MQVLTLDLAGPIRAHLDALRALGRARQQLSGLASRCPPEGLPLPATRLDEWLQCSHPDLTADVTSPACWEHFCLDLTNDRNGGSSGHVA